MKLPGHDKIFKQGISAPNSWLKNTDWIMTNPKQNKDLLGKGIRSLLQNIDADLKTTTGTLKTNVVENVTGTNRISIDDVEPNPKQPRRDFEEK